MLTYQQEKFASLLLELPALFSQHWVELGSDREQIPLAPDWNGYLADEQSGRLKIITVRDEGKLIGYFFGFIYRPRHYFTSLYAHSDMFFIYKEHMQGLVAAPRLKKLFIAAENLMRALGAQRMYISYKANHPLSAILKNLGYRPCDHVDCKLL